MGLQALEALFSNGELRALGAQHQCLVAAVLDGEAAHMT